VQEEKKIMFYYPTDVELDTKIRQIGLCEAIIKFTRFVSFVAVIVLATTWTLSSLCLSSLFVS